MHLCRPQEDGEQGRRAESAPIWRGGLGQDAKRKGLGGGEGIGGMSDTSVSQGCPHSTEHAAIAATNLQQGGENGRGQPGNLRCF